MRPKTRTWIVLSLVLIVATAFWWRLAHPTRPADQAAVQSFKLTITNAPSRPATKLRKARPGNAQFAVIATNLPSRSVTNPFAYRLSNTKQPFEQLLRNDRAVLLRNALIDTTLPGGVNIPQHLRAEGDPGSYIVQARGAITEAFRAGLIAAGAEIVSYIPNNAYLVRASADVAKSLAASSQSVLPFEPYYKLDARLLPIAVEQELSPYPLLNVVGFPGQADAVRKKLEALGAEVMGESEPTPYGPVFAAKVPAESLADVAGISEVQLLGVRFEKTTGNDLTRVRVRISTNTVTAPPQSHYPNPLTGANLTGKDIMVAITDTGVDQTHPDLTGRVSGDNAIDLLDFDGHGTHVAGTFFGDGTMSSGVGGPNATNSWARGSTNGANFSGMAPRAKAFVQSLFRPDYILQKNTAVKGALISNNSWGYLGDNDYDIFAASYDAAVRDSAPGIMGEQEVMYVFAAGNEGGGGDRGLNGLAGTLTSPATAKNVISVGATDLPRFITNEVVICSTRITSTGTNLICVTNRPWYGRTDTNNEVSGFSSRGNVGIGVEGVFGRIKPDVVAPGSMVVSTRSANYVDPDGATNTFTLQYNGLVIGYPQTNLYALLIPPNAVALTILTLTNQFSPTNLTLQISADIDQLPGPTSPSDKNRLELNAATSPALRAGTLYYSIANTFHPETISFDLVILVTLTNDVGNYYTVLKQLNAPLKQGSHGYRYESGTSMAAPAVSGFLACMQEYLGTNFNIRPSPALLKAMLINGARSLSANYSLNTAAPLNHQGWGLVNMSNSIPSGLTISPTNGPMRFFDQSLTNSLATGGTETYQISVPEEAQSYPLRITLVWTDPPGNPVTTVKLVNDLNLYVTGEDTNSLPETTGLVWLGNSFPVGSDFTEPLIAATNGIPVPEVGPQIEAQRDLVNNVENVYIQPPLARSYTVVVKGHRVNVNAVNSHSNSLAQDYALVISSGNVVPSNRVDLTITGPTFTNDPTPRVASLIRATNATFAGLLNQRVGANNPLIVSTNGATNQWAFFTYTNVPDPAFKYVAIVTFFPRELSRPRFREADIDLYVARGASAGNLFNLDQAVIGGSTRSTTRGGTEMLLFTNATDAEVFHIGVKSEDQQAANFSIFAASSDKPFSGRDASNNIVAQAIPLPLPIPDGSPDAPGGTNLFALVFEPDVNVQRIYVTNRIYHENGGDLIGILSHQDDEGKEVAVTLNNHRPWSGLDEVIYDDSDQNDLGDATSNPPVYRPDGPGRLRDFVGHQAFGLWGYTISDNALYQTGMVQELTLVIQPASTNSEDAVNITATIQPLSWLYAGFRVPADATNVQVCLTTDGDAQLFLRRGDFPTLTVFDKMTNVAMPGACMNYGLTDEPPLSAGRYFVGVYNPSLSAEINVRLVVTVQRGLLPDRTVVAANDNLMSLTDDATTNSFIFVTNRGFITSAEVDVRINHPRIADLALHLVNPVGTRLLLAENRGRDTTNGYGVSISNVVVTNFVGRVLDDGWESSIFGTHPTGTVLSGWNVDTGDVDIVCCAYGIAAGTPSHTGTNAVDLVGFVEGSVSTNVATTIGKTYRLSFAYCDNPSPATLSASARLDFNGSPTLSFSYNLANSYPMLNWLTTSVVFRATSAVTKVQFRQISPGQGAGGMFIDTVRMDEVQISTNSLLYATFTDDTLKAPLPIKFALPPFGDTNYVGTNRFISGFEGTNGGNFANTLIYTNRNLFTNGQSFDGWRVSSNSVYVQTNNVFAYSDTNYLLLRTGTVQRVLPVVEGKEYTLQFATRVAPRRLIYSTGVDEDALVLPYGFVDSHYSISSNSVTRATNIAYVLRTNTPPMGSSWANKNIPGSRWIGVHPSNPPPGNAFYGFKTRFNLAGYRWTNATLTGGFQVDGPTVAVRLNGTNIPYAAVTATASSGGFVTRSITNGFVPGINTLEYVLSNSPTPTTNTAMGFHASFGPDAFTAPLLFSNQPPPLSSAVGQVRLAGCYTNYFTAFSDGWRIQTVTFVARSNNVLLQFVGATPGVWLDHVQLRETGRKYYLPEEPLTPLIGQQAFGQWQLEVWDSRLGARLGDSDLLSWRLNLNYVRTNPPFVRLQNGDAPLSGTIASNAVRYFSFDVPCGVGTVSNFLQSLTLPNALDLWFNQDTFPLTGAFNDFPLLLNVTSGVQDLQVGVAPLLRSGRYYLTVRNTNAVPVNFRLAVGMPTPCAPAPSPFAPVSKASFGPGGFRFEWSADVSYEFSVQYADDPAGPWVELPQTFRSSTGEFSFTDDGTATGGLSPQRFYRLRLH